MQRTKHHVQLHLTHLISMHTGKSHLRCNTSIKITLDCQIGLLSFVDWKANQGLLFLPPPSTFPFFFLFCCWKYLLKILSFLQANSKRKGISDSYSKTRKLTFLIELEVRSFFKFTSFWSCFPTSECCATSTYASRH